jgi:hypothetical protein
MNPGPIEQPADWRTLTEAEKAASLARVDAIIAEIKAEARHEAELAAG